MATPENLEAAYESARKMILQWDARGQMIFDGGDRDEINQYLQAVDVIPHRGRMESLTTMADDNSVIKIAMAQLEEEFVNILTRTGRSTPRYSTCSSFSISDDSINYELLEEDYLDYHIAPSGEEINDLRSIAERMDSVKCVQVYRRARKGIVDVCFQRLGIEKLSTQLLWRWEWQALEVKITQWIRAAKFCVRIFFPKEKQLCEQIFASLGTVVVDFCFTEIVRDPIIQLFDFGEVISSSRRSPERLFKFLDLHETLSDLLPDLDILFQSKSAEPIEIEFVESPFRIRVVEILSLLAEAVRGTLLQLENALCHESSAFLISDGPIHRLTRYVMDYITRISNYKQSLTSLIVSKPSTALRYSFDQPVADREYIEVEGKTPLTLHLIWIIEILISKLEVKSKQYEGAHLFMMNNVHYIVQRIIDCPELRMMIGQDFEQKLIEKVQLSRTMLVVDSNRNGRFWKTNIQYLSLKTKVDFRKADDDDVVDSNRNGRFLKTKIHNLSLKTKVDVSLVMSSPTKKHDLNLQVYDQPFRCSGCKELGFGPRFRSESYDYEFHKQCKDGMEGRNSKFKIEDEIFKGCTTKFFDQLSNKICHACGKGIGGFVYHSEAKGGLESLDLHPCCSNLRSKLFIGRYYFELHYKVLPKCILCTKKDLHGHKPHISGWSYISSCKTIHFHVYCVSEMMRDAWRHELMFDAMIHPMALKKMHPQQQAKMNETKDFLRAIVGVLLGYPTITSASASRLIFFS